MKPAEWASASLIPAVIGRSQRGPEGRHAGPVGWVGRGVCEDDSTEFIEHEVAAELQHVLPLVGHLHASAADHTV